MVLGWSFPFYGASTPVLCWIYKGFLLVLDTVLCLKKPSYGAVVLRLMMSVQGTFTSLMV